MTGIGASVRAFAADLPGAWEDHPWGESVYKVGKKVFVFFGVPTDQPGLGFTVKLRDSHEEAMAFEWVAPSGYGLDRGGWVTCTVPEDAPIEMLTAWIEESYGLVAPKRLTAAPRRLAARGARTLPHSGTSGEGEG